jgi:hypothetical protein
MNSFHVDRSEGEGLSISFCGTVRRRTSCRQDYSDDESQFDLRCVRPDHCSE